MSTQKINFVSINLPGEDQFIIDADGVTLRYMDYLDVWGMDLERAEKVFEAALRSVQVIREFSGSVLTERGSLVSESADSAGEAFDQGNVPLSEIGGRQPRSVSTDKRSAAAPSVVCGGRTAGSAAQKATSAAID